MKTPPQLEVQDLFEDLQLSQNLANELLVLLKSENEALRKMDIRSLSRTTREKEMLLVKIHYLDNRISETVRQQCARTGELKGKKIADLVPFLSKEQGGILKQYNINLVKLRQEIQTKNLINKKFTSDTLLFINDAISVVTAPPKKNQLYGNTGRTCYTDKTPTMISREV